MQRAAKSRFTLVGALVAVAALGAPAVAGAARASALSAFHTPGWSAQCYVVGEEAPPALTCSLSCSLSPAAVSASASGPGRTPDKTPPSVQAEPAVGLVNHTLRFTYRLWDDSGRSRVTVWVERSGHVVARSRQGWRKSGFWYWSWRAKSVGTYGFCVSAVDAAGNKSKAACGLVSVYRHFKN